MKSNVRIGNRHTRYSALDAATRARIAAAIHDAADPVVLDYAARGAAVACEAGIVWDEIDALLLAWRAKHGRLFGVPA